MEPQIKSRSNMQYLNENTGKRSYSNAATRTLQVSYVTGLGLWETIPRLMTSLAFMLKFNRNREQYLNISEKCFQPLLGN